MNAAQDSQPPTTPDRPASDDTPGNADPLLEAPAEAPADAPAPGVPDGLIQALRSLSQEVRLSLLIELARSGPVCVTELSSTQVREACTISRHLTNMTGAGLVRFRQQGQQRFYSLDRERLRTLLDELAGLLGL